jgi:hypothetical protein
VNTRSDVCNKQYSENRAQDLLKLAFNLIFISPLNRLAQRFEFPSFGRSVAYGMGWNNHLNHQKVNKPSYIALDSHWTEFEPRYGNYVTTTLVLKR